MNAGKRLLCATLMLGQILPGNAGAFALLEPPAHGFVMNLDLSDAPFQTIGYGLTSWRQLAEDALSKWNAVGIGAGPDYGFFRTANPAAAGNACARDGVNQVTWAASNCGFSYGSAIAITNRWLVDGARVEEDVIFNSNVPYNAYQGPLARTASSGETLNDFFRVAVHEFGHAAGLDHPDHAGQTVTAIMNSAIGNIDSLQVDDIDGAHAIAWAGVSATTTTAVTTTTTTTLAAPGTLGMQNYFPFEPGHEWTYQHQRSGSAIPTPYKRVVGHTPVSINGIPTRVWSDSNGVARYMTNDANGVRRHANGSPGYVSGYGEVTASSLYAPPELYVPASVVLGGSLTQEGTIVQTSSDGSSSSDGYTQTIDFAADSTTVPAGTFNTVRVTNLRTISGVASTNIFWVADGVGIVKLEFADGSGALDTFVLSAINFAPAPGAGTLNLAAGWNLLGNGTGGALDVAAVFGEPASVVTVWKWNAAGARWAFYTPSLAGPALTDYANAKSYDVLTTIEGGEGFWVNAKTAYIAQLPPGTALTSASHQDRLAPGWNLIAVGDRKTPREFSQVIGLSTLWAWDAANAGWYFYAPSLDTEGALQGYISAKGYLDFGAKTLDPTTGFWVNVP